MADTPETLPVLGIPRLPREGEWEAGAQGNFMGDRGPSAPRWSPGCLHILADPRLTAVPEVMMGISLMLSKSSLSL